MDAKVYGGDKTMTEEQQRLWRLEYEYGSSSFLLAKLEYELKQMKMEIENAEF